MFSVSIVQVLVEELDYLPDEVDDMDPQIAAVVIEKSLPRPRAGEYLVPFFVVQLPCTFFLVDQLPCTFLYVFSFLVPCTLYCLSFTFEVYQVCCSLCTPRCPPPIPVPLDETHCR